MYFALVLCLAFQAEPTRTSMIEEMLAYIYVTHGVEKMEDSRKMFENQTDSQVRIIYRVFLDAKSKEEAYREQSKQAQQQMVLNQAQLNLQKAQAYRDHLAREFQMKIVQSQREIEITRQHQYNLWRAMQYGYPRFIVPRYYPRYYYGRRYRW